MVLKNRRVADQMGTLLAGAYLCQSTEEIKLDKAVEWVKEKDWREHTTIASKGDEERLLDRLASSRVRFNSSIGPRDTSIGQLIVVADRELDEDNDITKVDADRELRLYGIKVEDGCVYIANKSDPVKRILADTPWVGEWGRPLKDLEGAEATEGTIHFSPGIKSRATKLPIELFTE